MLLKPRVVWLLLVPLSFSLLFWGCSDSGGGSGAFVGQGVGVLDPAVPASAPPGRVVTFTGRDLHLGSDPRVVFGSVAAPVLERSSTSVKTVVPFVGPGMTNVALWTSAGVSTSIPLTVEAEPSATMSRTALAQSLCDGLRELSRRISADLSGLESAGSLAPQARSGMVAELDRLGPLIDEIEKRVQLLSDADARRLEQALRANDLLALFLASPGGAVPSPADPFTPHRLLLELDLISHVLGVARSLTAETTYAALSSGASTSAGSILKAVEAVLGWQKLVIDALVPADLTALEVDLPPGWESMEAGARLDLRLTGDFAAQTARIDGATRSLLDVSSGVPAGQASALQAGLDAILAASGLSALDPAGEQAFLTARVASLTSVLVDPERYRDLDALLPGWLRTFLSALSLSPAAVDPVVLAAPSVASYDPSTRRLSALAPGASGITLTACRFEEDPSSWWSGTHTHDRVDVVDAGHTLAVSPLSAPTSLTGRALSTSRVELLWTDTSGVEDGFEIERRSGGSFVKVASVGPDVARYEDTGLAGSTTYIYRVRAYAGGQSSSYTSEVSVTTACGG